MSGHGFLSSGQDLVGIGCQTTEVTLHTAIPIVFAGRVEEMFLTVKGNRPRPRLGLQCITPLFAVTNLLIPPTKALMNVMDSKPTSI